MAVFSTPEVLAEINRQAPQFGVDPNLVMPLYMAENSGSGDPTSGDGGAISDKKAAGVMQVIPDTARGLQKAGLLPADWKYDPNSLQSQVMAGIAAVKDMQSRAKNPDNPLELAATYNGGNNGKANYLAGKPLAPETADYLRKYKVAANNLGIKMPDSTNFAEAPGLGSIGVTPSPSTPTTSATTQRTTMRRSVNEPGVLDNFNAMIGDAINPGGMLDQAADTVIAGGQQRLDALAKLTTAITAKASSAADEAAINSTIESTAAVKNAQILARLNMDPAAIDNEAMKAAGVINDTDSILAPMKAEIDKRMQVGITDNPIEWIINQMRLPGMVAQYNGIVGTQAAAVDHYKQLANIRDSEQKVPTGMEADLLAQRGLAQKSKIANQAQEDLSKVQVELSGAASRDALTLANLAGTKAQLSGLQMAKTAQTETDVKGQTEKQAAEASMQKDLDNVNKMLKMAGSPQQIESLAAFKGMKPKTRDDMMSAVTSGKFGKDFSESIPFVNNYGNLANMAATGGAAVRQWVKGTMGDAGAIVKGKLDATQVPGKPEFGKKIDAEKETANELNLLQQKYEVQSNVDMRTASDNNPFKLAYTQLAKLPELANNPLATFINTYGPTSKDPRFAKVDEQYVLQRFSQSVANGTMTMPDASKAITEFYKTATQEQAVRTSWPLFGMEKPTKTYVVQIPGTSLLTGGMYSPALSVDLGNPVDVENFLTKSVAANAITVQHNNPPPLGNIGFNKPPL